MTESNGFATRIFGPDRATLLRELLPASAAEQAAQRTSKAKITLRTCHADLGQQHPMITKACLPLPLARVS